MNESIKLTAHGFELLKSKINKLQTKIAEHTEMMNEAIDMYGVQDEQYIERRERKMLRQQELEELRQTLKHAQLVDRKATKNRIGVGCVVELNDGSTMHRYELVPNIEADPLNNRISDSSPLGLALIGRHKGEDVEISLPKGPIRYSIENII